MSRSVSFKNVSKKYKMYNKNSEKLLDIVFPDGYGEDFYALQNISFTANQGDVIGIIGVNGAGKSTLSNLITGVIPPTTGKISIKGQASLIAIASGLDTKLTGRENIELKCLMLGFNKKEIEELMPEIIEFADIGKFIDQPVKTYSSGMKSRLGFAISVNIDPDILVIDEALSVGDQTFADKCFDKMNEFKIRGKTIFFISHSIGQVQSFCQKALWLEAGEVKAYGPVEEIVPQYQKFLKEYKAMSKEDQKNFKQIVIDKRSKLREAENAEQNIESPNEKSESGVSVYQGTSSRVKRKKKNSFFSIIIKSMVIFTILVLVAGGAGFAYKSDWFHNFSDKAKEPKEPVDDNPSEVEETPPVEETQEESNIRYISVPTANIRANPDATSVVIGLAYFGQSYVIEETQEESGVEWVKIINDITGKNGWVSSDEMATLFEKLNDEEVADQIDALIGFYPALSDAIPMIGEEEGLEQPFNYTEYLYSDNQVSGFKINVSDSSKTAVINQLGQPDLQQDQAFLYHGSSYDFVFTTLVDGTINTLTVTKQQDVQSQIE